MESTAFSEKLKATRNEKGFSQQKLSELTTIPKRTLEDWESGRRTPPAYVQFLVLEKISTL